MMFGGMVMMIYLLSYLIGGVFSLWLSMIMVVVLLTSLAAILAYGIASMVVLWSTGFTLPFC